MRGSGTNMERPTEYLPAEAGDPAGSTQWRRLHLKPASCSYFQSPAPGVVVVPTWIGLPRTGGLGFIIDQLTRPKHVRELSIHRDDGIAKEIRNNLNVLVYLG